MPPLLSRPFSFTLRRPKGFGFVEYRDNRDADEALAKLNGSMYGGREISVSVDGGMGRGWDVGVGRGGAGGMGRGRMGWGEVGQRGGRERR